jgi:hypothetical protein
MARRIKVKVDGLDEVLRQLGREGAASLIEELDDVTEKHGLMAVNEAKENAPRRDGFLKNSIHFYGRQSKMSRLFGSDRPYAARQEYEHATKKGFFRKALWNRREPFREEIRETIERRGK